MASGLDRGQLYQLTHASSTIDTRTFHDGGRMTSSNCGNGVSESRSYNTRKKNTLASISFSGATFRSIGYGWDDNKNKTSESITGTMSGYGFTVGSSGYDTEDRLVNWERSDTNLDQSWNLSLVGDWTSYIENSATQNRTHGPTHELLSAGGQSLSHDTKGIMTLIPSSLSLSWDFENKLTTADVGSDTRIDVTYKWDALGRRVYRDDGTSPRVFVQVGQQTIADYGAGIAASTPKYRYVYASYIDEPVLRYEPTATETLYYHRNQQYCVIALTDGSGAIEERYAYSAYGKPVFTNASGTVLSDSAKDNRYTYTGREWDQDLSLYHFRARMYDAKSGRFCGRDPIEYRGGSKNIVEILNSRPTDSTDPNGLAPCSVRRELPRLPIVDPNDPWRVYYRCVRKCNDDYLDDWLGAYYGSQNGGFLWDIEDCVEEEDECILEAESSPNANEEVEKCRREFDMCYVEAEVRLAWRRLLASNAWVSCLRRCVQPFPGLVPPVGPRDPTEEEKKIIERPFWEW